MEISESIKMLALNDGGSEPSLLTAMTADFVEPDEKIMDTASCKRELGFQKACLEKVIGAIKVCQARMSDD